MNDRPSVLVFALLLVLLVTNWISPNTFYVIAAILTVIRVANFAVSSGIGDWRIRSVFVRIYWELASGALRYAWLDSGYTRMRQFTDVPELHTLKSLIFQV